MLNLRVTNSRQTWNELLRETVFVCLVSIAFPLSAFGQLYNGPGFDPTPVEIPSVQRTAPRSVTSMDLLKLRDFHGIQISPDGKWVAFVLGQAVYESNSYRSGLFVVSTKRGSKPFSLGTAGPPHWDDINQWWPEDPQWSADSQCVYYRMKNAGIWQVWKWKREGGTPVLVTHLEHNVQTFQTSLDGGKLLLAVQKPSMIDPRKLSERGILYDGSIQAGVPRPFVDQVAEARGPETETWIHDLRNGRERKATEEESSEYTPPWEPVRSGKLFSTKEVEGQLITGPRISPDGKNVVYQRALLDPSESAEYSSALFVKSTAGGASVLLTPGTYYVDQYWWSSDSKEIYYTEYDNVGVDDLRPSKLLAVSATGGKPRKAWDSPGFMYSYSTDRAGRLLACIHKDNSTAPELTIIDLSAAEIRPLVNVNPEFRNLLLSPAKRIDVSNKYGDHFWGHLLLPLDYEPGKRYPLIITGYRDGDEFYRGGTGDEYPIQVFTANGFAVLNFDVGRARTSKPGDFETAILLWASPINGIKVSIEKLAEMGVIDSSRVAITGLSHGAEMVAYGISHSDLFRAAIESGPGSWDPIMYFVTNDSGRAALLRQNDLGFPEDGYAGNWQKISVALNAHCILTPLLINAADAEYLWGMQSFITLRELKKPVEMFIYPNELHVKNQPKHRYEIYERNLDWLNFWLQDKEDPNPAKTEQYKRWRDLRRPQEDQGNTANR